MQWIIHSLRENPELTLYLTLGAGFYVGRLRVGTFSLGTVTGVLLAGLIIGQFRVPVSPALKSVFFLLFLFATGYAVGPQFFRGLKSGGLQQALFAVIIGTTCLVTALVAAKTFGLGPGYGAGIFGGACTVSSVLGVATDAINQMPGLSEAKQRAIDQMSIAFAVTYIFGTAGASWFLAAIGPRILGVDLAAECKKLEGMMGGEEPDPAVHSAYHLIDVRAYRVTDEAFADQTVAAFEARFPNERLFIERLRKGKKVIESSPETMIASGDVLAIASRTETLITDGARFGVEVPDPELLDYPDETLDVMVTNKKLVGMRLGHFAAWDRDQCSRGIFVRALSRGGHELPFNSGTRIARGDVLKISGTQRDVERAVDFIGYAIRPTNVSDMALVGTAVFLGALVGSLGIRVGDIPISLSTSGGTLLAGLLFGWLRSVHPTFGQIPGPALWVFNNVGLSMFVAVIGLQAGPRFLEGLREAGPALFFAGVVVTIVPLWLGLLVGKHLFKMHPGILLGACAGARATSAALSAVQDAAQSRVPTLGYTVCFAVGNTLLTVWGVVMVLVLK
ncbi:MAG TPA: aspartate-alanine antiporter [Chthoniobacterales bacterium]